jgi:hypothetical protein
LYNTARPTTVKTVLDPWAEIAVVPEKQTATLAVILKPMWTYGVQLWGIASNSNIDILERFQSKVLRIITDAPWYMSNMMI